MIKINTLEEANKYLKRKETIFFQSEIFFSFESFENFVKEINNGSILEMPKKSTRHTWYCNFGTIYCNKLIVTSKNLYFFDDDIMIMKRPRTKTDDIEYAFDLNGASCRGNPIIYDCEQDKQFIDLHPIKEIW